MREQREMLVLWTNNAGPVAAPVLLDHHGGDKVVVRSAGSRPGDQAHPAVARIVAERGLDVSKEFPKALNDGIARGAHITIIMGAPTRARSIPESAISTGSSPPPPGEALDGSRLILDDIERRRIALMRDLGVQPTSTP